MSYVSSAQVRRVLAAWGRRDAEPGSVHWLRAEDAVRALAEPDEPEQFLPRGTVPPDVSTVVTPGARHWTRVVDDAGSCLPEWRATWTISEAELLADWQPVMEGPPSRYDDDPADSVRSAPTRGDIEAYERVIDALRTAAAELAEPSLLSGLLSKHLSDREPLACLVSLSSWMSRGVVDDVANRPDFGMRGGHA